jgi:hypothetical protein
MLICQLISGFTQSEETWNGVQELREKLLSELDDYSSLSLRIRLDVWNANWRAIARQMYMLRERYPQEAFAVVVFAYSWGVGNGLVKLAKELSRYGVDIDQAVISDGIYRHRFSLGNWRAVLGDSRIVLPANVLSVQGFYQDISYPMGRQPVSQRAKCHPWTRIILPHVEMDSSRNWHDRCIAVAKEAARRCVGPTSSVPVAAPASAALDSRIANGSEK